MSEFNRVGGVLPSSEAHRTSGVAPVGQGQGVAVPRQVNLPGVNFETLLQEQLRKNTTQLQFSKHAQERADQRGVSLTDDLLSNLQDAVSKARAKGARDVVVFDAKQAFIVNIPNNMVVTTITGHEMKENVFTNIDSAVIL